MHDSDEPGAPNPATCCEHRRRWLRGAFGLAVAGAAPGLAAAPAPARAPVQIGDVLSFPSWEQDRAVAPADVVLDAPPLLVYPRDPASGVVRDKSRLNQVLLLRLDPASLDAVAQRHARDGVMAYSGVCTHAACAVSEWKRDTRRVVCPCHGSEYDVTQHANVVAGPAPRALPMLPITLESDRFVVTGRFTAKVGLKKP